MDSDKARGLFGLELAAEVDAGAKTSYSVLGLATVACSLGLASEWRRLRAATKFSFSCSITPGMLNLDIGVVFGRMPRCRST